MQDGEYPRIATGTLFVIEKDAKKPKFLSIEDWLNKLWHIHKQNTLQPLKRMTQFCTDSELLIR